jgi:ATP adenylyltransferase/5',5'''-P-1,P-4-tetraphosphate phosphorylase II
MKKLGKILMIKYLSGGVPVNFSGKLLKKEDGYLHILEENGCLAILKEDLVKIENEK